MKILILMMLGYVWLSSASVYAAEPESEEGAEAESVEGDMRPSDVTDEAERGNALAGEVVWFEVDQERLWLAEQPARGEVQGGVLLLAASPSSANGGGHLATLRQSLPAYGWHTFFLNASDTGISQEVLSAALAQIQGFDRLLLICEGASCLQVVDGLQVDAAEIAGTVFINVPLTDDSAVNPEDKGRWRNMTSPGLILQEHPQGWPAVLEVATDVELQLLPMGRQTRQNSRILRKLRGWLKRRLQIG